MKSFFRLSNSDAAAVLHEIKRIRPEAEPVQELPTGGRPARDPLLRWHLGPNEFLTLHASTPPSITMGGNGSGNIYATTEFGLLVLEYSTITGSGLPGKSYEVTTTAECFLTYQRSPDEEPDNPKSLPAILAKLHNMVPVGKDKVA